MIHRLPFAALLLASVLSAPSALAQEAAPVPAPAAGPANLCQELVAFVKKPEEKKQEAATPAAQSTAVSNPSGKSDGQPSASGGQPQQSSGLSGPTITQAKAPGSETPAPANDGKSASEGKSVGDGKPGSGDNTIKDGMAVLLRANAAAKVPPPPAPSAPSPKPDDGLIAKIDAANAANDQVACRAAARTMRAAGVIMPPPLLALAALNPKFFPGPQP